MALGEVVDQIRHALDEGNTEAVAVAVVSGHADLLIEYRPEYGRVDFILACDRSAAAATVAVLPGVRADLELEIRELSAAP